jgi:hypothetical protein
VLKSGKPRSLSMLSVNYRCTVAATIALNASVAPAANQIAERLIR